MTTWRKKECSNHGLERPKTRGDMTSKMSVNKKECCLPSCYQPLQPAWKVRWGEFRMEKNRILTLESWDAYQRNNFNEPRLLHLPIYRKALKSLTWHAWFFVISTNLLSFDYIVAFLFFFSKNSYIPAPPLPLWNSPSELSESLPSQDIVLSNVPK